MAYIEFSTKPSTIITDLATKMTTGDPLYTNDFWTLAYPATLGDITNKAVLKATTTVDKLWVKKKQFTIVDDGTTNYGKVELTGGDTLADLETVRVYIRNMKTNLYLKKDSGDPSVFEFKVLDDTTLQFNKGLISANILVDYEKVSTETKEYFVEIVKESDYSERFKQDDGEVIEEVIKYAPDPLTPNVTATASNYFCIEWRIGDQFDDQTGTFTTGHVSPYSRIYWLKPNEDTFGSSSSPLSQIPINVWLSFDVNSVVGVIMGDPMMSIGNSISSPLYFGSLEQIPGALYTDETGNFAAFTGSFVEEQQQTVTGSSDKLYGDYAGTGNTDIIMAATKSGRIYQAHKASVFGGWEFRDKTSNGQSSHTNLL